MCCTLYNRSLDLAIAAIEKAGGSKGAADRISASDRSQSTYISKPIGALTQIQSILQNRTRLSSQYFPVLSAIAIGKFNLNGDRRESDVI